MRTDELAPSFLLSRRQALGSAAALVGGAAFLNSAAAKETTAAPSPKRGGVVNLLVDPEPTTLVALTDPGDPTMAVSAKVTEGLLCYDFDLTPQPQLATAWEVDASSQNFVFRLRDGVKWHDGKNFTSADVAFSILLLKQVHARGRSTFANVIEVSTPDKLTAVIRLAKPAPYLIYAMAGCESPMIPRHVYEGSDPYKNPNGAAPIGTGPFVFHEWVKGSHVSFVRNDDYWDSPKPYLDGVKIHFVSGSADRLRALQSGTVDVGPGTPVPLAKVADLRRQVDLAIETNGYEYTNQVVRLEFNLDHPILGRHEVRQAIAHAIDRNGLIESAWFGLAEPTWGPISPELKRFYVADIPRYEFDRTKSEQILDAIGLPRDRDGIRFRLTQDYVPAGDGYANTARYIAQALAPIGVEVAVRDQDFRAYIKRIYTDRDFDLTAGRANNMFDPTIGVQRLYWSKNFKIGVPFSNGSHFMNPEADALLESAATEADGQARLGLFRRFEELIARELPDLTLLAPRQLTIYNRRVHDHTVNAEGINANLARAFVES